MKRRQPPQPFCEIAAPGVGGEFLRGFFTTGLLAAAQDRPGKPRLDRRALRLALQGGSALAAGSHAARAWRFGQPVRALTSVALGLVAVATFEQILQDPVAKENSDGQEEA